MKSQDSWSTNQDSVWADRMQIEQTQHMVTCFAIYQSRFILTAYHNHIFDSLNAHNLHITQEYCIHHTYTHYKNHHNYVKVSFKITYKLHTKYLKVHLLYSFHVHICPHSE